jgi:hypothetical protein
VKSNTAFLIICLFNMYCHISHTITKKLKIDENLSGAANNASALAFPLSVIFDNVRDQFKRSSHCSKV